MSKFLKSLIAINCVLLMTVFGLLIFHMHDKSEAKNMVSENYYGEKIYLDDDEYNYASSRDDKEEAKRNMGLREEVSENANMNIIIVKNI